MAAELSTVAPENVPVAIESLFVPCTRYRDRLIARAEDPVVPNDLCEVELSAHGAQEGVLANSTWSWAELYSFVKGKVVWFSPEVRIHGNGVFTSEHVGFDRVLHVTMEFDDTSGVTVRNDFRVLASSFDQARVGCDRVLACLSSAFNGGKLCFTPVRLPASIRSPLPVSGGALSRFLSQSHGGDRRLRLQLIDLDTDQCQAIAAIEPMVGLDIELLLCRPTDEGASALMEGLRNSRGPSSFVNCYNIDEYLLLEALRRNTSVKKLVSLVNLPVARNIQALADNLGLVDLSFSGRGLNDETLGSVCESLSPHPTLEKLDLRETIPPPDTSDDDGESTSAVDLTRRKATRTNALVDMLRTNTKITSIQLTRAELDESLLDNEVYPRLKLNSYRPWFRAVSKTEGTLREPLLGRALGAVKDDTSLLFLLLSGSTDIDWVAIGRTRRSRKRVRYTK